MILNNWTNVNVSRRISTKRSPKLLENILEELLHCFEVNGVKGQKDLIPSRADNRQHCLLLLRFIFIRYCSAKLRIDIDPSRVESVVSSVSGRICSCDKSTTSEEVPAATLNAYIRSLSFLIFSIFLHQTHFSILLNNAHYSCGS